jgi:hypothetical protein
VSPITGVTLDPSSDAIPVSFSFTDNSVMFNFAGRQVTAGTHLIFDVATADGRPPVTPVPEPATALSLLAGLGALRFVAKPCEVGGRSII